MSSHPEYRRKRAKKQRQQPRQSWQWRALQRVAGGRIRGASTSARHMVDRASPSSPGAYNAMRSGQLRFYWIVVSQNTKETQKLAPGELCPQASVSATDTPIPYLISVHICIRTHQRRGLQQWG